MVQKLEKHREVACPVYSLPLWNEVKEGIYLLKNTVCFLGAGGPTYKGPFEIETKTMLNGHSTPMAKGRGGVGGGQKSERQPGLELGSHEAFLNDHRLQPPNK